MAQETVFNPFAPEMAVDPYPHYRRLRETDPVHRSPLGFWFLTRHADVVKLFTEQSFERQYVGTQTVRLGPGVQSEPYFQIFRHALFTLDPPDHRRIRHLFTKSFTPRRVGDLRPKIEAIADDIVDRAASRREIDVQLDYATVLPLRVIGELLGVPLADQAQIGKWIEPLMPVLEFLPVGEEALAKANEAAEALRDYFRALLGKRRAEPQDDLLTAMAHAATEGEVITDDELLANAIILYVAGQETSAGAIGLSVLALHRNPDQLKLLQESPELLPNAVVELLRYDSSAHATPRIATQAIDFGGVEIPAGSGVVGYLGAALRDPDAFPDPDRLDLNRSFHERPITFGHGQFLCLGHALAKQELEVAIGTLLRRCPDLALETLDPPFNGRTVVRSIASLPATW